MKKKRAIYVEDLDLVRFARQRLNIRNCFLRGVGDTTDVVEKQMYTFEDKGNRSITLRPEGTASAARAYIEHNLGAQPLPIKLYYIIPWFPL